MELTNVAIHNVRNLNTGLPNPVCYDQKGQFIHTLSSINDPGSDEETWARGIALSSVYGARLTDCAVNGVLSSAGCSTGIDIMAQSDMISLHGTEVLNIAAGVDVTDLSLYDDSPAVGASGLFAAGIRICSTASNVALEGIRSNVSTIASADKQREYSVLDLRAQG